MRSIRFIGGSTRSVGEWKPSLARALVIVRQASFRSVEAFQFHRQGSGQSFQLGGVKQRGHERVEGAATSQSS